MVELIRQNAEKFEIDIRDDVVEKIYSIIGGIPGFVAPAVTSVETLGLSEFDEEKFTGYLIENPKCLSLLTSWSRSLTSEQKDLLKEISLAGKVYQTDYMGIIGKINQLGDHSGLGLLIHGDDENGRFWKINSKLFSYFIENKGDSFYSAEIVPAEKKEEVQTNPTYIQNNYYTVNNNFFNSTNNYRNEIRGENTDGNIVNDNKTIIKKSKKIMKYNDEEINSLDYQDALEYDKRTYCEYYISLLKTKNNLIYSFCYNNDYNSKIIKIDLFFIGFTLFFTVNAIFFDDSTMHQIYEDKGSFNLLYQLPQIIYSTFISSIVSMILEFLALSEGSILNLKNNKENRNLNQRVIKLKKKLNIKFSLYFILSFLLLLLFWYYLSMFCSVYRNTQIHLIKDTLISFLLSFLNPFIIYLLPGIFRIPALSKSKNKRYCLYKFSQVLQMILSFV